MLKGKCQIRKIFSNDSFDRGHTGRRLRVEPLTGAGTRRSR